MGRRRFGRGSYDITGHGSGGLKCFTAHIAKRRGL
jgi:hypothetical protein